MTEKQSLLARKKSKIVLLLINPIFNYITWKEEPKIYYYSLHNLIVDRKEKLMAWKEQKSNDLISLMEKINNLAISSNEKLRKILEIQESKLIFINYPRSKEDLQELEKWIRFADQNPPTLLLVHFTEKTKEIFAELKNTSIICPLCERSWKKELTIKAGTFLCPADEISFSQNEIEKFNEHLFTDHTKKNIEIIEYGKKNKYKILQRELSLPTDFESEILQKSLQEQINKI
ncbi:hypothetical protein [endosymbiont GvMRE of Glomus versiforme]|uniref:hypothetical protein n=1 Tax=endosymbiont GvMRE of Glomus versiforme TaxID=2039283 RepID=UPI000EC05803|nr:hypothetical protein [endosymbiont GvMRE of Glomus versiforme]RHZ36247.1 hypothetical protein GvMRE_Ic1g24 [endosymbiont GvMRE of Glomus versiforme]